MKRGRALLRSALRRAALLGVGVGLIAAFRLVEMEHPANGRTAVVVLLLAGAGGTTGLFGSIFLDWLGAGPVIRTILGAILSAPAIVGLFGLLFFIHLRLVQGRIDADFEAEGWRHLIFRLVHDTGGLAVATGSVYLAPWVLASFAAVGALGMALPSRRAL